MTNSLRQILSFIRDPHPNEEREVENQWSILIPQSRGTLGVCHMCYVYIRMFLIIGKTIIFGIFHKTKFESKRAEFKTLAKTLKNFKSLKCERIKNDWLLCLFWPKPVLELLITKMRKNDCLFCLFIFFSCVFSQGQFWLEKSGNAVKTVYLEFQVTVRFTRLFSLLEEVSLCLSVKLFWDNLDSQVA